MVAVCHDGIFVCSKDSTKEIQYALSSILKFSNRVFEFDMPVRITSVSFTLKWSPRIKFLGVSNSNQSDLAVVTVFGKDSRGGAFLVLRTFGLRIFFSEEMRTILLEYCCLLPDIQKTNIGLDIDFRILHSAEKY